MAYGGFNVLTRRTASDKKIVWQKRLIFLKILNVMDIKEVLLQWFIKFFIKKTFGGTIKIENMSNEELAEELPTLTNY